MFKPSTSRSNWDLEVLVLCEWRKPGEPGLKPSEQEENQQNTQPACDAEYRNRTRFSEVGGERLSTTASPVLPKLLALVQGCSLCSLRSRLRCSHQLSNVLKLTKSHCSVVSVFFWRQLTPCSGVVIDLDFRGKFNAWRELHTRHAHALTAVLYVADCDLQADPITQLG